MLEVEATGKNLEQAIENALFELKAPREDVDIKILDEGGFFRKAKVRVSISPDEIEKYQKREKRLEDEQSLQDNEQEDVGDVEENNPSNEEIEDDMDTPLDDDVLDGDDDLDDLNIVVDEELEDE